VKEECQNENRGITVRGTQCVDIGGDRENEKKVDVVKAGIHTDIYIYIYLQSVSESEGPPTLSQPTL